MSIYKGTDVIAGLPTNLVNTVNNKASIDLDNLSTTGENHFDSKYVNVTGDTMSGNLTAANFISNGGQGRFGSIELGIGGTSAWGHGGFVDFHYNGSTADYTSRIAEYSSGKLYIEASNGISLPQSYNIDGQWVSSELLISNVKTTGQYGNDLKSSFYLPNDGYVYEVVFNCHANSHASTVATSYIWTDVIGVAHRMVAASSNGYYSSWSCILPVRNAVWWSINNANFSEDYSLRALGYRRIGTNG